MASKKKEVKTEPVKSENGGLPYDFLPKELALIEYGFANGKFSCKAEQQSDLSIIVTKKGEPLSHFSYNIALVYYAIGALHVGFSNVGYEYARNFNAILYARITRDWTEWRNRAFYYEKGTSFDEVERIFQQVEARAKVSPFVQPKQFLATYRLGREVRGKMVSSSKEAFEFYKRYLTEDAIEIENWEQIPDIEDEFDVSLDIHFFDPDSGEMIKAQEYLKKEDL